MRILIFGDSIVNGEVDYKNGGWVNCLKNNVAKFTSPDNNDSIQTYGLGVSSNTSIDLLKRFESEIKSRIRDTHKIVIIIAIGINDAVHIKNRKNNWVPLKTFSSNIQNLANIAKKYSNTVVFVGLNPVEESKTNPLIYDDNQLLNNNDIATYDKKIKSICQKNNINHIDIFNKLLKQKYGSLLDDEDGLHPNTNGHKLIFEIVKSYLIKNKIL